MRRYGELRKLLPITFVTFGLGYLAIIGVPPFAGFFSKDAIIETAFNTGGLRGWLLGGAALLGAGITAFYMTRVMLLTFFGRARWTEKSTETYPHESPAVMTWPMIVLAVGSVGAGAVLAIGHTLQSWLEPVVGSHETEHVVPAWVMTVTALGVVAIGVAVAYRMYAMHNVAQTAPQEVSALTVAARRDLYGDAVNEATFMRGGQELTKALVVFDDKGVDGAADGLAHLVGRVSDGLRQVQTGFARSYALSMLAGAALVIAAVLFTDVGVSTMTNFPILTLLWAIPVVGAAVIIVLPASLRQFAKYAGLFVALALLALALLLAVRFNPAGEQFQFVENHPWIPSFGTGYILGVDGIALALVVLTAVLVPLLLIAGWHDADDRPGLAGRGPHSYIALTLAVEGMVLMSLVALDILLFYVFFEAMLIPMYFLIGGFGNENRSQGRGEVPAVQPVRRAGDAGRGDRAVRGDLHQHGVRRRHLRLPRDRRCGVHRKVRPAARYRQRCCSSASCSPSRSKPRCGRSTAGCPVPRCRPPRPRRC